MKFAVINFMNILILSDDDYTKNKLQKFSDTNSIFILYKKISDALKLIEKNLVDVVLYDSKFRIDEIDLFRIYVLKKKLRFNLYEFEIDKLVNFKEYLYIKI